MFSILTDWWIGIIVSFFLLFNPYFDADEWINSTINCLMKVFLFFLPKQKQQKNQNIFISIFLLN